MEVLYKIINLQTREIKLFDSKGAVRIFLKDNKDWKYNGEWQLD